MFSAQRLITAAFINRGASARQQCLHIFCDPSLRVSHQGEHVTEEAVVSQKCKALHGLYSSSGLYTELCISGVKVAGQRDTVFHPQIRKPYKCIIVLL